MATRKHAEFGTRADLERTAKELILQGYTQAVLRTELGPKQYYLGPELQDQPKENQFILIWDSDPIKLP